VQRQEEAARIASKVDGMLVVGSPESSNTRKLYEICKSKCFNTHYIQTADDLNQQWFLTADRVGVTAGASTPQNIIEEVLRYVRGI
jgi:4-hydroxy-3-methylbut-2-enyl diphosphate reductase